MPTVKPAPTTTRRRPCGHDEPDDGCAFCVLYESDTPSRVAWGGRPLRLDEAPPPEQVGRIRHLLYHVYPHAKHEGEPWRWSLAQLRKRIGLFNGLRLVAIVTDGSSEPAGAVKDELRGCECEFVEMANDPGLREVATFEAMFGRVSAFRGPHHATLYAHAKGSTSHDPRNNLVRRWSATQYETMGDHWPAVHRLLCEYPVAGSFKRNVSGFAESRSTWHYSGSWFWFRNDALFSKPDWRRIDRFWAGIEPYPSLHFDRDDAGCVFWEWDVAGLGLYQPATNDRMVEELVSWRAERLGDRSTPPGGNRCRVIDGEFPPELVAKAAAEWPAGDWRGWVRYDTADERKGACADWPSLPPACRELLAKMATYPHPWNGAVPDLTLYGGGMHETRMLGRHLDSDRHKLTGMERVGNAILFLNGPEGDGGEFVAGGEVVPAKAGRLLLFTLDEGAVHEVRPCAWRRKSLALFYYAAPAPGFSRRPRALFLGGGADRLRRAGL